MTEKKIHKIKVLPTSDSSFKEVARMVELPDIDLKGGIQFFPAFTGFETGGAGFSELVDISYLYVPWHRDALNEFDKHVHSEELFVVLQGDFYMIIGSSEGGEYPCLGEMRCYLLKEGDMFVQKRNVWHTACWPVDKTRPVKYIMVISGHRTTTGTTADRSEGEGDRLDDNVRSLPDGIMVMPDI